MECQECGTIPTRYFEYSHLYLCEECADMYGEEWEDGIIHEEEQ